jgi:hypothetical protein
LEPEGRSVDRRDAGGIAVGIDPTGRRFGSTHSDTDLAGGRIDSNESRIDRSHSGFDSTGSRTDRSD